MEGKAARSEDTTQARSTNTLPGDSSRNFSTRDVGVLPGAEVPDTGRSEVTVALGAL